MICFVQMISIVQTHIFSNAKNRYQKIGIRTLEKDQIQKFDFQSLDIYAFIFRF